MKDYFNVKLDDIRAEVHKRTFVTDDNGNVKYNEYGEPLNNITSTDADGKRLIDKLVEEVEQYKALQTTK